MKPGDFVKSIDHEINGNPETGIILSTGYNMWGEEIEGQETGVKVDVAIEKIEIWIFELPFPVILMRLLFFTLIENPDCVRCRFQDEAAVGKVVVQLQPLI